MDHKISNPQSNPRLCKCGEAITALFSGSCADCLSKYYSKERKLELRAKKRALRDSTLLVYVAQSKLDSTKIKIGVCKPSRLEARMEELQSKCISAYYGGYTLERRIHGLLTTYGCDPPRGSRKLNGDTEWFTVPINLVKQVIEEELIS